jgi:ubiquinone/menaquinone biosynthesis C-methylase UbiE
VSDTKSEGSYKASEMHPDVDKEIERLRLQSLWTWDQESRNLVWFGLKDGMSVLDLGSGPGFVTEQLLQMVPNGHITQLERDPDMVRRSEQYLTPGYTGRFTIVEGDIMNMELPDNSFDFAFARYLFQHLPDPADALREVYRVLKPGGVLAITDVDDKLGSIFEPEWPETEAIDAKVVAWQAQKGGDRHIGRKLWRMLAATGYQELDLQAVIAHSDKLGAENMIPPEWDPGSMKPFLDAGVITKEDVEAAHREHIKFHASPDKYALFTLLMAKGEKAKENN